MTKARGVVSFLIFTAAFAALDLGTKAWAFEALPDEGGRPIIPGFLQLTKRVNIGAAFSMFEGQFLFFYAVSGLAIGLLLYFAWTAPPGSTWRTSLCLGLLGGGVLGNLHDRVQYGHVRDFVDAYIGNEAAARKLFQWFGTNHWPTFNAADAFILIGAGLLIIKLSREDRAARRAEAEAEEAR